MLPRLTEQWDGEGPEVLDPVVAEDDGEETEYAALMTAADASAELLAGLPDGRRRRVVGARLATGAAQPLERIHQVVDHERGDRAEHDAAEGEVAELHRESGDADHE